MMTFKKICISMFLVCLSVSSLYAKRAAPKEIKLVQKDGIIYSVPHFVYVDNTNERRYSQKGGYVLAREARTGRLKWLTQIYITDYDEKLEQDVQDVFITEIKLDGDNLIVEDEKGRVFSVNIKTLEVTQGVQEQAKSKFSEIDSKTIEGVVIPKEYFQDVNQIPVSGVSECWTIGKFDFEDLDNRLEKYLREEAKLRDWYYELPNKFRTYKRQYVGIIVNRNKRIWVNLFCQPLFVYWKSDLVEVIDGGDCYFHVEYDIKSQKFLNLWINGEA